MSVVASWMNERARGGRRDDDRVGVGGAGDRRARRAGVEDRPRVGGDAVPGDENGTEVSPPSCWRWASSSSARCSPVRRSPPCTAAWASSMPAPQVASCSSTRRWSATVAGSTQAAIAAATGGRERSRARLQPGLDLRGRERGIRREHQRDRAGDERRREAGADAGRVEAVRVGRADRRRRRAGVGRGQDRVEALRADRRVDAVAARRGDRDPRAQVGEADLRAAVPRAPTATTIAPAAAGRAGSTAWPGPSLPAERPRPCPPH